MCPSQANWKFRWCCWHWSCEVATEAELCPVTKWPHSFHYNKLLLGNINTKIQSAVLIVYVQYKWAWFWANPQWVVAAGTAALNLKHYFLILREASFSPGFGFLLFLPFWASSTTFNFWKLLIYSALLTFDIFKSLWKKINSCSFISTSLYNSFMKTWPSFLFSNYILLNHLFSTLPKSSVSYHGISLKLLFRSLITLLQL